jgi:Zn-dependent peptidase ImmA (M78 family)
MLKNRTFVLIMYFEVIHLSYIYRPFPLEEKVMKMYKNMNIYKPEDIDIRKIAYYFRIHLKFSANRSYSFQNGNFMIININKSLNKMKQREVFFHELCHLLRHYGNQYKNMPRAFRELQEWDAEHFTRYAAIPFHMLSVVNWNSKYIINEMATIFCISENICKNRLDHITRNKFIN